MPKFEVTVSKGIVTYEIEANTKDEALDIADEYYNERGFETEEISLISNES